MDAHCRIEMFGSLRVWQSDTLHTRFRTHKAASLLAYLALHINTAHAREALVELFWPEMDPATARDNLSTTLSQLRRQLEPAGIPANTILFADRQQVRLNPMAVATDVGEFEALLEQAARCETPDRKSALLEQAVELYQGDLLTGSYEDWAVQEQARLQSVYLQSLHQLERLQEEAGRYEAALATSRRAIRIDPYLEEAYRAQMRLYLRLKRPAAALELFDAIQKRFQQELGVLPSAITRQMAQRIRQDPNAALLLREPSSQPQQSALEAHEAAFAQSVASPASSPLNTQHPTPEYLNTRTPNAQRPPPLPLQLTRFFGRRQETEQLLALLQTPAPHLVTLLGPGGAGKTRLAIEIAHQMQAHLPERVWFVSLADLPDAALIPSALLHALRLSLPPQADPLDGIVAALGAEPCLLILDNFEHLLRETESGKNETPERGGAAIVRMLLEQTPSLCCLVTSRQVLRLGGEQEFLLPPLATPPVDAPLSLETLMTNESVALYVDRARLARADFALNASNAASVLALCRKLEGMPLAIEMAAAWAKTLPPAKMLERLEHQLDLLVSRRNDLPPRHRSLRATIEWSYEILPSELQQMFVRLAVFRGGWTLEAAEAVCGHEAPMLLAELQERSLSVAEGEEEARYRMLETLREFGLEKLRESNALDTLRLQHANYYRELAQQQRGRFHTPEEKIAFDILAIEQDNLREAMHFCLNETGTPSTGIGIVIAIWWFWKSRGPLGEGRKWLELALQCCPEADLSQRATLLDAAATLTHTLGDFSGARTLLQEAVEIQRSLGDWRSMAYILNNLAIIAYDQGDIVLARTCWEENLKVGREQSWDYLLCNTLANLGELAYDEDDLERARLLLEEAVVVRRRTGDLSYVGHDMGLLGKVAVRQRQWVQAERLFAESLTLRREVEDRPGILEALEGIAGLAAIRGQAERAAPLFAFAAKSRADMQLPLPPNETREVENHLASLRTHLNADTFSHLWQEGQRWTQEQACVHALEEVRRR